MINAPVAVCSRTFSKHPGLREKLLEKFSNVQFNDKGLKLAGIELVEFLKGKKGAIVALEDINDTVLSELPELKVLSKYGVGLDGIDQEALKKHGVQLGWTGGVNKRSVSELALGMILSLLRRTHMHSQSIRSGEWKNQHGNQLTEKTVGIIGCGHIGKDLVQLLTPFNCKILINDILDMSDFCKESGVSAVSKDDIYASADIVSLHVPLTNETRCLIGKSELEKMKETAVLVNTSRGGVVDEAALELALKSGEISAAGLDVFVEEPPEMTDLFSLQNFLGTPHNGGSSREGVLAMGQSAIDNLYRHLEGQ